WQVGFVRAATELLDSIVLLSEQGHAREAGILLRSLLELAANQRYMADDPARAVRFAGEELTGKRRIVGALREVGIGDESEIESLLAEIGTQLKDFHEAAPEWAEIEEAKTWAFGLTPKKRIGESSGAWLRGHYTSIFM